MQRTFTPTPPRRHATVDPLFLRRATVVRMTGLGRSTIYRMLAEQQFPSPVLLGPRAVAWRRADLVRWSDARPSATR